MSASFSEILTSRLFKFIVGEENDGVSTEFFVHEEAVAQISKPLHALVRGGLSEAQSGYVTWKDVDKETFERFIQFAYTGDYSIPKPGTRVSSSKSFTPERPDEYDPTMEECSVEDSKESGPIVVDALTTEPTSDKDDVLMFQPPASAFSFQPTANAFGFQSTASAFGFHPTVNAFGSQPTGSI